MLTTAMPDPKNHHKFYANPTNCVTAAVTCQAKATELLGQLRALGFEGDAVGILHGEDGIRILDRSGRNHGLFARIWRLLQYISVKDHLLMRSYEDCMEDGGYMFKVQTDGSASTINRVATLFDEAQAKTIAAFFPLTTRIFAQ